MLFGQGRTTGLVRTGERLRGNDVPLFVGQVSNLPYEKPPTISAADRIGKDVCKAAAACSN